MQKQPDTTAPPPKSRLPDPAATSSASPPGPAVVTRPIRVAPIGACSPNSDGGGSKPPVPSRAAVNKKLLQQQQSPVSPPPPPIPARSQAPKAAKSPKEERIDSGRESDDFAAANDSSFDESKMKKNFKEFLRDNMSSYATSAAATGGSSIVRRVPPFSTSASVLSAGSNGDEGFSSSHEDQSSLSTTPPAPPPPPPRTTSAAASPPSSSSPEGETHKGRQLTNHHRAVQKPRDIKYRSKLKSNSTSTLGVLEEHQVVSSVGGASCAGPDSAAVTTVTYWTEPYL